MTFHELFIHWEWLNEVCLCPITRLNFHIVPSSSWFCLSMQFKILLQSKTPSLSPLSSKTILNLSIEGVLQYLSSSSSFFSTSSTILALSQWPLSFVGVGKYLLVQSIPFEALFVIIKFPSSLTFELYLWHCWWSSYVISQPTSEEIQTPIPLCSLKSGIFTAPPLRL